MKEQRSIQQAFERFQSERAAFASGIYEFAKNETNIDSIEELGGHLLLLNLLQDPVASIQTNAILALGRFASQSQKFSKHLLLTNTVQHLISLLSAPLPNDKLKTSGQKETSSLKRAAASALRAIAKQDVDSAAFITNLGAVDAAMRCLHSKEADVKESAAWLLDCLVTQSAESATMVVDAGELQHLVSLLSAPELGLKRAAVSTLGSIAQRSADLASAIQRSEALAGILSIITSQSTTDTSDIRMVRSCLFTAFHVIQESRNAVLTLAHFPGALPVIAEYLTSMDHSLQRFAAAIIEQVARDEVALNELMTMTTNCVASLVQCIQSHAGPGAVHIINSIGYICEKSSEYTDMVISLGGLLELTVALAHNDQKGIKIAAAWALVQAASHSADQAQAVAESGALLAMHAIGQVENVEKALVTKCNEAACTIIHRLESMPALIAILNLSSSVFITAAMERLYQIFCHDRGPIKANFVELGGLQLVLEMSEDPETLLQDHATKVAALFPQELVNRYSPAYNRAILEKLASGYEDQPTKISSTIEAELSSTPAPQENQAEGGAALDAGFTNNELQIESIENDETKCECQDTSNIEESFEASNGDDRRSVEQSLTNSGCE